MSDEAQIFKSLFIYKDHGVGGSDGVGGVYAGLCCHTCKAHKSNISVCMCVLD